MDRHHEQVETKRVSVESIMRRANFKRGVEDVRAGRAPTFDEFGDDWTYERGRQWASIAPVSMPIKLNGELNPKAVALYWAATDRRLIL
jgi:hypothetical protein